jgi:hypothetical protein
VILTLGDMAVQMIVEAWLSVPNASTSRDCDHTWSLRSRLESAFRPHVRYSVAPGRPG